MAILLEEKEKKVNWSVIIVVGVLVIAVGLGVYYLFFAPAPAFEVLVPPPLQSAQQISRFQIDPANVVNSQGFRILRSYAPSPTIGVLGRPNPFLPF